MVFSIIIIIIIIIITIMASYRKLTTKHCSCALMTMARCVL